MVHSVMAIPKVGKLKRDNRGSSYSDAKNESSGKLFASILEETANAHKTESAPRACRTILYDRESRLQNFNYLTREYHY